MANMRNIFTLGVFDFSTVVKMLVSQISKTTENVNSKLTPPESTQTRSITVAGSSNDKLSVRMARAWLKYWNCVTECQNRIGGYVYDGSCDCWVMGFPSRDCPNCLPYGTYGNTIADPPTFPCCSSCVQEKCMIATGNTECRSGENVNETLLTIAQVMCYNDQMQRWLDYLDCYECVNNAYVDCKWVKCRRPLGPEPETEEVLEVLPEEEGGLIQAPSGGFTPGGN